MFEEYSPIYYTDEEGNQQVFPVVMNVVYLRSVPPDYNLTFNLTKDNIFPFPTNETDYARFRVRYHYVTRVQEFFN